MINNCIDFIQSSLLPQACLVCRAPTQGQLALCDTCHRSLPLNRHCCPQCALPLPPNTSATLCAQCSRQPPAFDQATIPLLYRSPVDKLIWRFKFRQDLLSGRLLSQLFVSQLPHYREQPPLLLPVPLHPARLRQRGFNQAFWLARQIAWQTGLTVDARLLKRITKTRPQHELDAHQRHVALHDAFRLSGRCDASAVAIVDDVLTTGATANAIAALLKNAGCSNVHVWCIARTPPPQMDNG